MAARDKDAVRGTVQRRLRRSEALLKRMGVSQDAYEAVALNALVTNPALEDCTPLSMDTALIEALSWGLLPDGEQACIVPFKNEATFIPMVAGQIRCARDATPGLVLRARTVYSSDEWEYREGLEPMLHHIPKDGGRKKSDVVAVYAMAKVPGAAEWEYEVLLRTDIDRYRAMSRANRGPWENNYSEMGEKSAIKLVLKRLPRSAGAIFKETPPELTRWELDATPDVIDAQVQGQAPEPEPETASGARSRD